MDGKIQFLQFSKKDVVVTVSAAPFDAKGERFENVRGFILETHLSEKERLC